VKYVKCFQFEINSFIKIERVIQFDNFRVFVVTSHFNIWGPR
jgi:hypothetical protein